MEKNYKVKITSSKNNLKTNSPTYFFFDIFSPILVMRGEIRKKLRNDTTLLRCNKCGNPLSTLYSMIINTLFKKDLLVEKFVPLCCDCYE